MSENTQRRVEATDLDTATAASFLEFLYKNQCSGPSFKDACIDGRWYAFPNTTPGSCLDMISASRRVASSPTDLRLEGRNMHITQTHKDASKSEHELPYQGPGFWARTSKSGSYIIPKLIWHDCQFTATRKNGMCRYVSKVGEVQYARFWGQLLCAADKYCVDSLISLCEERLIQRLSLWSAVPMLQCACLTGRLSLKQLVLEFITLDGDTFQRVKDMPEFDSLDQHLQNEIMEVFLRRLKEKGGKRPSQAGLEFPDGQDWPRLSCAQLRRACAERGLDTGGDKGTLAALLQAREREI